MRRITIIVYICIFVEGKRTDEDFYKPINSFSKKPNHFDSYTYLTEIEEFPNICDNYESEQCAKMLLKEVDILQKRNNNRLMNIAYKYSSNINKSNEKLKVKFQQNVIIFEQKMKEKLRKFQWNKFQSPKLKRIFQLLSPTIESNNASISQMLLNISSKIEFIYNNGRPCFDNCLRKGEADITNVFRNERNYEKLLGLWISWRNETGRKIKNLFVDKIQLQNIGAKENGYSDAASFILQNDFEEMNFSESIFSLYEEVLPLYKELHGYVRYCLSKFYPGKFDENGPIPAHILGNLWGQQWGNIMPIIQKCRRLKSAYDIQEEVNKNLQSVSINEMFKMSEDFFTSLGMYKMTPEFWQRSVLQEQSHKVMDCHGSAIDLSNGYDFRIMMCTKQNMNDFSTIHHEMGHIEYFMTYRNLPYIFQDSANSGFHEAIGDTITLSVNTPEHLQKINLISSTSLSTNFDIDYLLITALNKVAFLPFALTMDSYIWSVYNGSVPHNKLNKYWWDLRYRFQGLKPPIERTEDDFDPGAKYHIAFGVPYIRYFVSFLLQFKFYESMCKFSGHSGPLHRCDFYESKLAGTKLLEMLRKGRSQHWRKTLEILTGSRDITSTSIMNYFEPLYKWLKKTNKELNIKVGW